MANVRVRDAIRIFVIPLVCSFLLARVASATAGGKVISLTSASASAAAKMVGQSLVVDGCSIASGFYPLVPTWTLVRGSKTAIRWRNPKRIKKIRSHKKTPFAKSGPKVDAISHPNFQEDNPETELAPHSISNN